MLFFVLYLNNKITRRNGGFMEKRINIIVGHYGSGKTEFALNFAFNLKKIYEKVYIIDLDIVNPYFRTADVKEKLNSFGIDVIASQYACTNVDIPALPPDIIRVFSEKDAAVVFDVGGDDDGAIALGRYKQYFEREPYELLFVVNTFRPLTKTADDIKEMMKAIEIVSRLKITGLVNNSNLASLTTINELISGQKIIEKVSSELGVALKYISGLDNVISQLPDNFKNKAFNIKRYLEMS